LLKTKEIGIEMFSVGIAGFGVLGKHMSSQFPQAKIFDKYAGPSEDLTGCDFVFVAVPTPWNGTELDCSEVEAVIRDTEAKLFVIRSTCNVGFIDYLKNKYNKKIVFQPEYIGETINHSVSKVAQPPFIVLGGDPEDRRKVINIYATIYNSNINIRQLTIKEAEVVKLSENRAIFFKLLQAQELFDACEANGVDYYTIREIVYGDDPRMELGWSFIYEDNRGATSKCIPKDIYAWAKWADTGSNIPTATNALLKYNEELVRKNGNN
jgi:UDPglucose 6-dehydrogenase